MGNLAQIIKTCLPLIVMLSIGVLCRQKKILDREQIATLKYVIMNITLPALLFSAFATSDFTVKNIPILLMMYLLSVMGLYLGKAAGKLLHESSPMLAYTTTTFEVGMIGYSMFMLLHPEQPVGNAALVDFGHTIFLFTAYKALFAQDNGGEKVTFRSIITGMFTSPAMIGVLLGVFFAASGLYQAMIPSGSADILDACIDFVGAPTSAIILLTVGYDLVFENVPLPSILKAVISRLVIMAVLRVIAGYGARLFGMGNILDDAMNVIFILPPTYTVAIFATDEEHLSYVSTILSVETIISVIAFIALTIVGI